MSDNSSRSSARDIAVIGISAKFAQAPDVEAYWRLIAEGKNAFSDIPADRWSHAAFYDDNARNPDKSFAGRGAFIDDIRSFPALTLGLPPRRVEVMDPQQRMALELAIQAIESAGLKASELPRKTGVFMGVTANEYRTLMVSRVIAQLMATGHFGEIPEDPSVLAAAVERLVPPRPMASTGLLANMIAGAVGQELHLRGPAYTIDSACSSSLVAVHDAMTHLRGGTLDAALVGGVYLCLTPEHYIAFSRIGAMSKRGECRPFDERADGFVQGEGGAMVLLMRLDDAKARGLRVDAVLQGSAVNNDGGGDGPMAPIVEGQLEVISDAWGDAAADPSKLGYLETHGTGTLVGDVVEVDGLMGALGDKVESVALGSTKANIGHTMSAAGIAGLMRAILALKRETIPPMANFESPKPTLKLDERPLTIPTAPVQWQGEARLAAVSSFGFGGTNAHVVVGDGKTHSPIVSSELPELFVLSSYSEVALRHEAGRIAAAVERDSAMTPASVARALGARLAQPWRAAFVATTRAELLDSLQRLASGADDSAPIAQAADELRVAWLYPGQGSQRVNMIKGLRDRFKVVREALDGAGQAVSGQLAAELQDIIYPAADSDQAKAMERLTATENCQPALIAVAGALTKLLRSTGMEPDMVAGHSVGEFSAGYAAGLLSLEHATRWGAMRGRAMAAVEGDPGAMAALAAGVEETAPLLRPGAMIANINHPTQTVISGATEAVHDSVAAAEEAGLRVTLLKVSHAFHSQIFDDVSFDKDLDTLEFSEAALPIVSCIDDLSYRGGDSALDIYKRHASSSVNFLRTIQNCHEKEGAQVFLQVGAGGPLATLVKRTYGVAPDAPKALTLASSNDDDAGASLLETIGELWAMGVKLDPRPLCSATAAANLPPAVLPRERYWAIKETPQRALDLRHADGSKVVAGERLAAPAAQHVDAAAPVAAKDLQAAPVAERAKPASDNPSLEAGTAAPSISEQGGASDASAPAPVQEVAMTGQSDDELQKLVLDAVSKASAYPLSALKPSMRLMEDLGFDSLMAAELSDLIKAAAPGFAGFTTEIWTSSPTITKITQFVAENMAARDSAAAATDDDAPLRSWSPIWRPAPLMGMDQLRDLIQVRVLLVGEGGQLRDAVSAALRAAGAQLIVRKPINAAESDPVDLIVHTLEDFEHPTWNAVAMGDSAVPLLDGLILDHLTIRARRGERPDFLLVGRQDDIWLEGAAGALRALSEEWPSSRLSTLRFDTDIPAEERADAVVTDWCSPDRSKDVLYDIAGRAVMGFEERPQAAPDLPAVGPNDRVLVSGGTRGIGAQIGRVLAAQGAEVILLGRSEPDDRTRAWIAAAQGRAYAVRADITDAASLASALSEVGDVTIFIHAAGLLADGALESISPLDGERVRRVKVMGWVEGIRACGSSLRLAYALSSWAGRFGNRHQSHYAAANAQLSAITKASTLRLRMAVGEFGPWTDSHMVSSIPAAQQQALRAQGVDFIGTEAGIAAVLDDLSRAEGPVVWGRNLVQTTRRIRATQTVDLNTSPYLADHAIEGVPVLPMAAAADELAWWSVGNRVPYVIENLEIYRPVTFTEPQLLTWQVASDEVTLKIGPDEALAYKARVATPTELPTPQPLPTGGSEPALLLEEFYSGVTFHGPRLQGIEAITAVGDDWVMGTVKTGNPQRWLIGSARTAWTLDPLMFDSAMQMAGWVAWQRYGKGAIPVAMRRWTQILPVLEPQVTAVVRFNDAEDNKFEASIDLLDSNQQLLARAEGVIGELRDLRATAPDEDEQPAASAPEPPAEPPPALEIKPEWVDFAAWPEIEDLDMRLQMAEQFGLKNPYFDLHDGTARGTSFIDGREYINFSSYNYLGLSGDSRVLADVHAAIDKYGTSCSASRVASGERAFHRELEAELARAHNSDDAIVFTAGHATNVTTIGHLFGPDDLILHDELIHDSILQGIKLSGAARRQFRHDDPTHLEQQLRELRSHYKRTLIVIEGVYSMDGDIAKLPEYVRIKRDYGCMLMVDEAHSFGTIGATGRGIQEHFGVGGDVADLWMGTMSKSLASVGGWIAGPAPLIRYLRYTAPGFIYSAGLPPASAVAALSSLRLMLEEPWRVQQLQANSRLFCQALREQGVDTGPALGESPVVPVITGDSVQALMLSDHLLEAGINAKPIVYPAVANDASRLRCFISSTHTEEQLLESAKIISRELARVREELGGGF